MLDANLLHSWSWCPIVGKHPLLDSVQQTWQSRQVLEPFESQTGTGVSRQHLGLKPWKFHVKSWWNLLDLPWFAASPHPHSGSLKDGLDESKVNEEEHGLWQWPSESNGTPATLHDLCHRPDMMWNDMKCSASAESCTNGLRAISWLLVCWIPKRAPQRISLFLSSIGSRLSSHSWWPGCVFLPHVFILTNSSFGELSTRFSTSCLDGVLWSRHGTWSSVCWGPGDLGQQCRILPKFQLVFSESVSASDLRVSIRRSTKSGHGGLFSKTASSLARWMMRFARIIESHGLSLAKAAERTGKGGFGVHLGVEVRWYEMTRKKSYPM